jgi:hypothetical protein
MRQATRTLLVRGLPLSLLGIAIVALLICWQIGTSVSAICEIAIAEHPGGPIEALIAYAGSPEHALTDRNRAVWARGQLGDHRALPFLESRWTGAPCDHQNDLCQRGLAKAIALCRGGTNLSAHVWRGVRDR